MKPGTRRIQALQTSRRKGFYLAKRRGLWIGNITDTFATQRKLVVEEILYEVILCREDTW